MQAQEELILIKGKRSKRARPISPVASTMATSSSTSSGGGGVITDVPVGNTDRSTLNYRLPPSYSGHELTQGRSDHEEEEDMANCLILLAKGQPQRSSQAVAAAPNKVKAAEVYQCKTCNKSYSSFQALGGHRASHNKPIKPIALEEKRPLKDQSTTLSLEIATRTRVHECSICGAEFSSGQALGGHMRRHRPTSMAATSSHGASQEAKRPRTLLPLDLNLPAPEDHDQRETKFPFAPNEQIIVFSASPLIDCHY